MQNKQSSNFDHLPLEVASSTSWLKGYVMNINLERGETEWRSPWKSLCIIFSRLKEESQMTSFWRQEHCSGQSFNPLKAATVPAFDLEEVEELATSSVQEICFMGSFPDLFKGVKCNDLHEAEACSLLIFTSPGCTMILESSCGQARWTFAYQLCVLLTGPLFSQVTAQMSVSAKGSRGTDI